MIVSEYPEEFKILSVFPKQIQVLVGNSVVKIYKSKCFLEYCFESGYFNEIKEILDQRIVSDLKLNVFYVPDKYRRNYEKIYPLMKQNKIQIDILESHPEWMYSVVTPTSLILKFNFLMRLNIEKKRDNFEHNEHRFNSFIKSIGRNDFIRFLAKYPNVNFRNLIPLFNLFNIKNERLSSLYLL